MLTPLLIACAYLLGRWRDGTVDEKTPPACDGMGLKGLWLPPVSWGQGVGQFN